MLPFYTAIKENLDARGVSAEETRVKIKFREKVHVILDDLPRACDRLTLEANRNGETMDLVLEKFDVIRDEAFSSLVSLDPEPSQEQLDWAEDRLDSLRQILIERGDKHISDLNEDKHKDHLKIEGGEGYTVRYLCKNWGVYDFAYSSIHPIPELQDRVLQLSDTQQALVQNQYQLAQQVDNAFRDISKLEKLVMSAAYQEGDRTLKCFKKTPGWASIPEEEIKKMFRKHLADLGATSTPALDVIKPRSGKNPFLKVTFMTAGEKREFNNLNKISPNKYESKTLTPQSVLSYQREIEKTVVNTIVDWLKNEGFNVHDKDVRLLCLPQYRPEFHLSFRVFINGLPGFPRTGKSHSFVVRVDNTNLEEYIREGMSQVKAPERRAGRKTPPPTSRGEKNRGSLEISNRDSGSGPALSPQNLGAEGGAGSLISGSGSTTSPQNLGADSGTGNSPPKNQRKPRGKKNDSLANTHRGLDSGVVPNLQSLERRDNTASNAPSHQEQIEKQKITQRSVKDFFNNINSGNTELETVTEENNENDSGESGDEAGENENENVSSELPSEVSLEVTIGPIVTPPEQGVTTNLPEADLNLDSKEDEVVEEVISPGSEYATPTKIVTPPQVTDGEAGVSPPQSIDGVTGVSPIISEEEIANEINKIGDLSQEQPTPKRQNQIIIENFWESVGASAKNLKFNETELEKRLEVKSLFKSNEIRKAKGLLESFSGGDMDTTYPQIGKPSQIETSEQLAFVLHLHKIIKETERGPTSIPKSKKQSKMPAPTNYNKK